MKAAAKLGTLLYLSFVASARLPALTTDWLPNLSPPPSPPSPSLWTGPAIIAAIAGIGSLILTMAGLYFACWVRGHPVAPAAPAPATEAEETSATATPAPPKTVQGGGDDVSMLQVFIKRVFIKRVFKK